MVLPLAPFAVRGVLWYQGESDDEDLGAQACHRDALACIINDWRAAWKRPDLAFFVVQLPGFRSWLDIDAQDYVTIRAAQQDVSDATDGVWLCSIGDVGEELDIHPKNKLVPGHRLALLALRYLFGRDVPADAPRCTDAVREGQTIRLSFSHAEGLKLQGEKALALEVASDGESLPFSARVEGHDLVLTLAGKVMGMVTVRLGWQNWHVINLVNGAGIPALPFEIEVG
jgi:sialate O-acetylesterase